MPQMIPINLIRADPDCQPRVAVDPRIVEEYADDMAAGATFPSLTVFHDGEVHWLADGFTRLAAAMRLERAEIACDVRDGDKRAAILYSVSANATHGARRSNADKRRAVAALIELEPTWGDRAIAESCLVTHPMVIDYRKRLVDSTSLTLEERVEAASAAFMRSDDAGWELARLTWEFTYEPDEPESRRSGRISIDEWCERLRAVDRPLSVTTVMAWRQIQANWERERRLGADRPSWNETLDEFMAAALDE